VRRALAVALLAAAACSTTAPTSTFVPSGSPVTATPHPTPVPVERPSVFLPSPNARLPTEPPQLADQLERVTSALRSSLRTWVRKGDPSHGSPPQPVVLQTLYQQRIYRVLARDPKLARRTLPRLSGRLRREAKTNVTAGQELFSLVTPVRHHAVFLTQRPEPAGVLLRYYQEAEQRFGVDWEVLASINYIESKFGRVKSPSTAGAQGPMQFIPSTWAAYGLGGDVHDPHDSILGAANYLRASGAPQDYRSALFAYNHATAYVNAVLLYANQIARDPLAYYDYYNWQVFVFTPFGDRRLTGPGLD
jgi:hypothetical protein